jgi:hypothetical protein
MIRIYPHIEFDARCPGDGMYLNATRIVIPGMRCLAEASCPSCGVIYYVDMPVGHAIRSPITLNMKTGEVYDSRNIVWFSSLLKNSFENKVVADIVPVIHSFFFSERIVIINCLDFLYGHSLLKLLNVQRYLDNFPDIGCCVLVPSQLLHLVPEGVAEIWELPVPVQDGWKWYNSLQRWIDTQLNSRRECFLSRAYPHPSNRLYNLNRFIRNLPDISNEIDGRHPVILFSYREDRLWGRDQSHQQRNLQKLYDRLGSIFPEMALVIAGFGREMVVLANGPRLIDLRYDSFDKERDLLWMAYMQKADCVIGIHGSNMLLPSGLAKSTVELVPRSRLGNTVQDFLFSSSDCDPRDSLLFYRMMYGNDNLSDIMPSEVADMVACILSSAHYNSWWFQVGEKDDATKHANSVTETGIFQCANTYLQPSTEGSFIKRIGRKIAERMLEMID